MEYIIIGYTSEIDIKTNTAKIKYATRNLNWIDNIDAAYKFNTREQAEKFIKDFNLHFAKSYGIKS